MKCPKCRYLSFEPELRCKHCGYDFSLAETPRSRPAFDELEQQDPDIPMVDLQLRPADIDTRPAASLGRMRPAASTAVPARRQALAAAALAEPIVRSPEPAPRLSKPEPVARPADAVIAAPVTPTDLPLFLKKGVTNVDLEPAHLDGLDNLDHEDAAEAVRVPAAPRPLVVRRKAPDSGRVAGVPAPRPLPLGREFQEINDALTDDLLPPDPERVPIARPVTPAASPSPAVARFVAPRVVQPRPAPAPVVAVSPRGEVDAPARLKAAGLDLALLAVLNAGVILLTLRQCDLTLAQIGSVPMVPFMGFLLTITAGYLLLFNVVSARTIGKMIFGLHVVADAPEGQSVVPTPRQLSYRALLTMPSVLLLGLGFLPGLVGEGLAIHDRLTHTRVVRE